MIRYLKIDGFKSLNEFEIRLKPGLNILVGPNGAGKTNIINFFEFLSKILDDTIQNVITKIGGAGAIFTKIGKEEFKENMNVSLYGKRRITASVSLHYEYSFSIKLSLEEDIIYFEEQSIKLRTSSIDLFNQINEIKWDLEIHQSVDNELKPIIKFAKFDKSKLKPRPFYRTSTLESKEFKKEFEKQLQEHPEIITVSLLKQLSRLTQYYRNIYEEFRGGETYNIIPSRVKQLEDSAATPGINKDGSGLASTLYAMKKAKFTSSIQQRRLMNNFRNKINLSKNSLNRIISFVSLANPAISNIDVDNDPFSNKLQVKVTITDGTNNTILPLSAMSDGTLKWITLITAILTSREIFSIEEPENYLHPWMQAEIIKIMRSSTENKRFESFILLTTHSETLLNFSKPDEIIIVSMKKGNTIAKPVENIDELNKEISNTGFGLGHFYFSNSLEDE